MKLLRILVDRDPGAGRFYAAPVPNGGVPLWQFIRPVDSPYVFVSKGPTLRLVSADDFASNGAAAASIAELSPAQVCALMDHLSYWCEQIPMAERHPEDGTVLRDY